MKLLSIILCIVVKVLADDKLLNVQAIWRHGARNYYYCNWNCDENQARGDGALLTPTGMRQQYVLGKWIRQRYIIDNKFLSEMFNENEIYIESSDVNRTLQSAYSQLQGMYPEGPEVPDVGNDKLLPPNEGSVTPAGIGKNALPNKIQLIPIHTKQKETDYAIALSCPKSGNMTDANKKTELYKKVNDKSAQLYKDFNTQLELTGDKQVKDFVELSNWRDTFICNRYNGDLLPTNLKSETLKQMDDVANLAFSLEKFQTWEQSKLYTTPYFRQVIDNFDSYLNGSSHFKYRGSSGHDSTLLAILSGLNLTSAQCQANRYLGENDTVVNCITKYVEFASNIIFELFNNTVTGPYVKVLYNGEYVPICSDYGKTCKYSTFRSIILAQQVDHKKMCNIPDDSAIPIDEQSPGWAIAFFVIVTVLAVGGGAVVFIIQSKLRSKTLVEE